MSRYGPVPSWGQGVLKEYCAGTVFTLRGCVPVLTLVSYLFCLKKGRATPRNLWGGGVQWTSPPHGVCTPRVSTGARSHLDLPSRSQLMGPGEAAEDRVLGSAAQRGDPGGAPGFGLQPCFCELFESEPLKRKSAIPLSLPFK